MHHAGLEPASTTSEVFPAGLGSRRLKITAIASSKIAGLTIAIRIEVCSPSTSIAYGITGVPTPPLPTSRAKTVPNEVV